MTVEEVLSSALSPLVDGRCYPDIAPLKTPAPFITYQQVGGTSINFMDSATLLSKRPSRFQVNCWALTRKDAIALAQQADNTLRSLTALQTTVEGELVAIYEDDTKLRGTHQDFSFFY